MTKSSEQVQTQGSEIVALSAAAPRSSSMKKVLRAVGAGSVSAALVGAFVLPTANASAPEAVAGEQSFAQALSTNNSDIAIPAALPQAEEQPAEPEAKEEVVETRAEPEDHNDAPRLETPSSRDIPSGAGASGVLAAALAQIGVPQDCTDLVQNSLAAAGYTTRRDQGGYDHGTSVGEYLQYGQQVSLDALAPGDILIYGYGHVAIYAGNGMGVHGLYGGITQYFTIYQTPGVFSPMGNPIAAVRPA